MIETKDFIFVISAPSGAGKSTLIAKLMKEFPVLSFSVSTTTRTIRPGEVDGKDYHFVTDKRFDELLAGDYFLEWANIHTSRYGTSMDSVKKVLLSGRELLLDVDVQGGEALREKIPDAHFVFIVPPSFKELESRLVNRQTESPETLAVRLKNAREEMKSASLYDFVIVNDDLEKAYQDLKTVYLACHMQANHVIPKLNYDS
ncbi:guanylate kinase [Myxococcota bacterium]|nr:guanylate kinase [Myxococcota bacterium]MBU1381232.1 guanylate kinase [Myxococcota bacterium]MBU1496931.1 guanylate kinase [Myxococcota bacterium]